MKYEEFEEYVDEWLFIDLWKYQDNPNLAEIEDREFSVNKEINDIVIMIGDQSNVMIWQICSENEIIDEFSQIDWNYEYGDNQ